MKILKNRGLARVVSRRTRWVRALLTVGVVTLTTAACDVHGISEPGELRQIVVSPDPQSLTVNGTMQFTAVGMDFEGRTVPMDEVWSVASGGGTISDSGLFTAGGSPGTFTRTVTATSGGLSGTATVVVMAGPLANITVQPDTSTLAIGASQQFTAIGTDAAGNEVDFTPTWSVQSEGGTIGTSGLFTAGTETGTFASTVRASSGNMSGSATVIVTAGPLASIDVTPDPTTLTVGGSQQLAAVGRDAYGNLVEITPVWSVVAEGGTVSAAGLFTAGTTPGTYTNTARATSGGISGTATVVVNAGALASITVTPDPVTLDPNTTQEFTAVGRDAAGNELDITAQWSVVAGGGTINGSTGVFTAGNAGGTFPSTIRATSGGISGTASVTITAETPVLETITVTPASVSLQTGATQRFTAVGRDGNGDVFPINPDWSVVAGGGTIDPRTGVFTAGDEAGTFPSTVRATRGGISGTASVTVTAPAAVLETITVTPASASVLVGGSRQFTAVGRDGDGNVLPITPVWSVVAGGGTINSSTGVFTAGTESGSYPSTIRATSGGKTGSASVTVTAVAPVLQTITVTPSEVSLLSGDTQEYTAIGRDGNGNIFPITPEWSVEAGGGTINPITGVFTAGDEAGLFNNTVTATDGLISGTASVEVTAAPPPPPLVNLGAAAPNGIMAGESVTCVTGGVINADVSISPGNALSGFGPCVITGVRHLGDDVAAAGQLALTTAYNTLANLPCPGDNAIVADLGGTTKGPGVYCTGSGIGVTGTLTLDGRDDPNATFVFQAGTSLTTAGNIVLINGAQASNVYWQVGTSATLGTASQWQGNILALTSITLVDNANLTGRALARTGSVTLGTNNIITLP